MSRPARDPLDRFWDQVEVADHPSGCWMWNGCFSKYGYGRFTLGSKLDGSFHEVAAHRFSYEEEFGPVPDGLVLDHLCREKACVNPMHLEAVSMAENTRRGLADNASKTECLRGHRYDQQNTYFDKSGSRACRACRNARARERRAKAAAR